MTNKLFTKTTVVDEVLAGAERYNILDNGGGTINSNVQINLNTSVSTPGTALNAALLNALENGVDAIDNVVDFQQSTSKVTPANNDVIPIEDSAASYAHKKLLWSNLIAALPIGFSYVFGDGVNNLTTGFKGSIQLPCNFYIDSVALVSSQSSGALLAATATIQIWSETDALLQAGNPIYGATQIDSGSSLAMSGVSQKEDSTLSGWTRSFNKSDWLGFYVSVATTGKLITLSVLGHRT